VPTPIYTAFSLLQLPHGLATTTHNHSRRGHYIYIYIYIYMSFSQTVFCLANLVSSVCPTPLAQMFDRLLRSTPAPAHEGTRLRSTRGYTRAQAPRCDARAPAVSRRHRTPHSETSPADPNPTELIAPPPPPMSSCGLDGLIGLNGALSLSSQPAGDTLSGLIGLIGLIRLCGESQQSSFFVFRRPSQPEPAVDTP